MVTRRASLLGKILAPEAFHRGSSEAGAGTHPMGLGEQIRTEESRGLQTHCRSSADQLAPPRPEVQVRNAQLVTFPEQVEGSWGLGRYAI